jgi:hypothetical protein
MKKTETKQKLFEMMERINPEFKQVDEISSDAALAQKATTPLAQRANSRIDTPQEFQDAFQVWLGTTGFNPQKKPISIGQAQTLVRNAMINLGFK